MAFNNRKWVIITLEDYDEEGLSELVGNAIQSSPTTLRKSVDGKKAILKWDGETPSAFVGMTAYSHSEILAELSKSAWMF